MYSFESISFLTNEIVLSPFILKFQDRVRFLVMEDTGAEMRRLLREDGRNLYGRSESGMYIRGIRYYFSNYARGNVSNKNHTIE